MALPEPIIPPNFVLNNGITMPSVGMGTYRIRQGDTIMQVVDYALAAGYRMFDTAAVYGNEIHLREALNALLPKYDLEREEIFITTKLSPSDHGGGSHTERAYRKSLENLGLDYLDLYLIHFPGSAKFQADDRRNAKMRGLTWSKLTELYDEGKVNAIGVSNFTVRHLQELMDGNHGIVPAVNQVEWHPYYNQSSLYKFCKRHDIALQAYCSFGGTSSSNDALMNDPVVLATALKLDVTPAQLLLVWALQQDIAVIPKSVNPVHIKQNISLNFKIPEEDMKALNQLGEKNIKYAWDPSVVA